MHKKLGGLPKQHETWHFTQILDLAGVFNEIPDKIINYLYKLNTLRNRIAHKPKEFTFTNVKTEHKKSVYNKKEPVLHGLCEAPDTDDEIYDDWVSVFLVTLVVFGNIFLHKKEVRYYDSDHNLLHRTNSPSGFDIT